MLRTEKAAVGKVTSPGKPVAPQALGFHRLPSRLQPPVNGLAHVSSFTALKLVLCHSGPNVTVNQRE